MFKHTSLIVLLVVLPMLAAANPMRPDPLPTTTTVSKPRIVVSAPKLPRLEQILIIGEYRLATFNGGIDVMQGEEIAGYIVSEIFADHVIVIRNRKQTRLDLDNAGSIEITPVTEE